MSDKYDAPNHPPPAHLDAGPYAPASDPSPGSGAMEYYNPTQQHQQQYPQNNYGPPVPYNQGGYGPPQPYYGPPQQQQQGMYYGPQQGYPPQGYQPQGYYANRGNGPGAAEGICAGLLGALACCCCIDFLF
ncbi:MAG: hypothetical protein Q9191_001554 [Dirinaria sp. TL-2023a]